MLAFFRRIRQNLLNTGSLSRYTVYAIGEILLVMIGILLALQVNNWNQNHKDQKEEKEYLERIVKDLKEDLVESEETISSNESALWASVSVIDKLEGGNVRDLIWWTQVFDQVAEKYKNQESIDLNKFGATLYRLRVTREFGTTNTAFQELVSTGKINLIRNKDLRNRIQTHYVKLKERSGFQEIVANANEQYGESLIKNGVGALNQNSLEEIKENLKHPEELIATLQNYFNVSGICLYVLFHEKGSIIESTEMLIEEIEQYLN